MPTPLRSRLTPALDTRFVDVDGQRLRIAVKRGPRAGIPLVVFNGLGGEMAWLRPLALALDDLEVVLFDVPGLGGSPVPRRPYSLDDLARLVDTMLVEAGYRGPVDVMGMSWGGALAQQFARGFGRRCRRLVLAATCAGALAVPARWSAFLRLLDPVGRGRELADELGASATPPANDDAADAGCSTRDAARIGYLYQQLAICGWTSLPWLAELRQPTLILAGTRDPLLHVVNARVLECMIADSELRLIDDGHLFVLTSAVTVAAMVRDFLLRSAVPDRARRAA